MNEWFALTEPWWHFAVRGVLTYLGLLLLMRLAGKRSFGEMSAFDVLVLVLVGGTLRTAIIGDDHTYLGAFIGVNNTLVTTAVMSVAPVERPVASATYGFVRFIGGGLAPFVAGKLVEHYNAHVPFLLGAGAVLLAAVVLATVHRALRAADRGEIAQPVVDELDRAERDDALPVSAGIGNES